MSPVPVWAIIVGSFVGYVAIASFLKGILYHLTEWDEIDDISYAALWPISWVVLSKYPGRMIGKKIRKWFDERAAEESKKERIRIQEENRQRIEIENIERELEEEERLRRNETYYQGK